MPLAEASISPLAGAKQPKATSLSDERFRPRWGVVSAHSTEAVLLLDRLTARYFTLPDASGRIWDLLVEGLSPREVGARMADEYEVEWAQVTDDVTRQLELLARERLIEIRPEGEPAAVAPSAPAAPLRQHGVRAVPTAPVLPPSVLRCAWEITAMKLRLRRRGFDGTLRWIAAQVGGVPARDDVALEEVQRVEYHVAMAAAVYPARARCLEQSLTLYYLLRRQGVTARYCQGAQAYPFHAHAWVEYQGEVINDVAEHTEHFARFPNLLP
jgi:hypothetical protein